MAEPTFPEVPTVGADGFSSILEAKVFDVDTKRYTVSVVTEGAGRKYCDIPVMSFYAHHERAEGGYVLPDIGAPCWIATDAGGGTPFILGFKRLPRVTTTSQVQDPDQAPQEGDEVMGDYGAKMPRRQRGEFGWTTRDGAFLHYRKGGIVEIGSKASCQRLFIPIGNHIRDVCENYGQLTAAGVQYFEGGREEGSDGSDAHAKWRLLVKAHAADTAAAVLLDAGIVRDDDEKNRFRIVVKKTGVSLADPNADVPPTSGVIGSSVQYAFYVDADGNIVEKGSNVSYEYNELAVEVANDSTENVTGKKKIDAAILEVIAATITLNGAVTVEGTFTANLGATVNWGLTVNGGLRLAGLAHEISTMLVVLWPHVHEYPNPLIPTQTLPPLGLLGPP